MKEVTYEDWQKNPTPRMMWVWNYDIKQKLKTNVFYIMEGGVGYPVVAQNEMQCHPVLYVHCAEIEEPKTRRMTNQELSWWLQDGKHREWKRTSDNNVYPFMIYLEQEGSELIPDNILIRENGGEWHEPLVEVEE